jgi:hypothetical protein
MIYEEPFRGRAAVVAFMGKVRQTIPADLKFVIDDITDGDPAKVGLTWWVRRRQRGISREHTQAAPRNQHYIPRIYPACAILTGTRHPAPLKAPALPRTLPHTAIASSPSSLLHDHA